MLFKSFCVAAKVVVATATQSEKIAEEVQAFIKGVAQKISNKIGEVDQNEKRRSFLALLFASADTFR